MMVKSLVITKIETLPNGKQVLECMMIRGIAYEDHLQWIKILGTTFVRVSWDSDREIICYKEQ